MNSIENESVYAFDIDKTLISERRRICGPDDICARNPYTGELVFFKPNHGHVDLLKEMAGRDRFILVWSAAGVQWAKAILQALDLSSYVEGNKGLVITKPLGYVDDQKAEDFMKNHIYLAEGDRS